jgi:D-glycero-D-manno-heptose 1,7-bisphosphate phosphatase
MHETDLSRRGVRVGGAPPVRRAVFLDRDGTMLEEGNYVDRLDRLIFFPYTIDAIRALNDENFAVVVVTNQSGVARGMYPESFVTEGHEYIDAQVRAGGARVDGYYYCPHHPEGSVTALRQDCDCRKPRPGQLLQAAKDLNLDLPQSFIIGDRWKDIEAGKAVGARAVLVRTGYGREAEQTKRDDDTAVVDNLIQAVAWILRQA